MKKYLALAIAICLLLCSAAFADTLLLTEGADATADVHFRLQGSDGFKVTIPASIELDSRIESSFSINLQVEGNLDDYHAIDVCLNENEYYGEWTFTDDESVTRYDRGFRLQKDDDQDECVQMYLTNESDNSRQLWPYPSDESSYSAQIFDNENTLVGDGMEKGYNNNILHYAYFTSENHDDNYSMANIGVHVRCYEDSDPGYYSGQLTFSIYDHDMDDRELFENGCIRIGEGDDATIYSGGTSARDDQNGKWTLNITIDDEARVYEWGDDADTYQQITSGT